MCSRSQSPHFASKPLIKISLIHEILCREDQSNDGPTNIEE